MRQLLIALSLVLAAGCDPTPAGPAGPDASTGALPADAAPPPDAGPAGPDAGTPDAYILEVQPGVYQLDGFDPALPDNDLDAFAQLVGDAQLIGLGESVHTSGGYYAAKDRLIRYLVEHLGVRGVAFETPRTKVELETDRYVQTCEGTAIGAARGIFEVFADLNSAALLEWLCQWNLAHPDDRVHVWGFDMQQPSLDRGILLDFLRRAAPADAAALMAATDRCSIANLSSAIPDADWAACTPGLDALGAYLDAHRAALESATNAEAFLRAQMAQVGWRAWQDQGHYFGKDEGASYQARDVAMARIFETWLDFRFPGVRTAIWAHNYHLTARHPEMDRDLPPSVPTFGSEVYAHRGESYAAFALTSYETGINWPSVGVGYQPLPERGSVEWLLHEEAGRPYLLLDPTSSWLGPTNSFTLGGAPMIIARQFRGVFYLEDSPGMDALFW